MGAKHCRKSPIKPGIAQITLSGLHVYPTPSHASTSIIWCHMTNHECYFMGKAKYCG